MPAAVVIFRLSNDAAACTTTKLSTTILSRTEEKEAAEVAHNGFDGSDRAGRG